LTQSYATSRHWQSTEGGTRDLFPADWPLFSASDEAGFIAAVKEAIDNQAIAREKAVMCGKRARTLFSRESVVGKTMRVYAQAR
jgi:hypothetical protein